MVDMQAVDALVDGKFAVYSTVNRRLVNQCISNDCPRFVLVRQEVGRQCADSLFRCYSNCYGLLRYKGTSPAKRAGIACFRNQSTEARRPGRLAFVSTPPEPHRPGISSFTGGASRSHPAPAYLSRNSPPALQVRQCPHPAFGCFRACAASPMELAPPAVAVAQAPA